MATCDLCGEKLGLVRFRYRDGFICKRCYALASGSFTSTVRNLSREELEEMYERRKRQLETDGEFLATKKVGDLVQLDERNGKVCLPHNRRMTGDLASPEFILFRDVRSCGIETVPPMDEGELAEFSSRGDESATITSMLLWIRTADEKGLYEVPILSTPVRATSFAFQQSYGMAVRALGLLDQLCTTRDKDASLTN